MVNSGTPAADGDVLSAVRDRALQATDVSFVITAAQPGSPIVWVNDAFTRTTGYLRAEVEGRGPDLLHGPDTDRTEARRLGDAVRAGRSTTATVLNYRKDGTPFWNQVSVSPVADGEGRITHWVGIQVDVTEQVRRATEQQASIEVERRARSGLALVSQVSDMLADLDNPYVLREIAAMLRGVVVDWAVFLLEEGGLRAAHGIRSDGGPVLRARPDGEDDPGRDEGGPEGDLSLEGGPEGSAETAADPVQELLDGLLDGPVEVTLDDRPVGPATRRTRRQAREIAGRHGDAEHVVVHAVPGRRGNVGVLVVAPRGSTTLDEMDDGDHAVLRLVVRRVGLAVDNARLWAREHRLAETLQRAMLPEQAEVQDLDVWSYYAPSSGHAQVGGDWYDVLQVDDDRVVLVIGDVVGHDVEAAAAMGQLRSMVRSFAFEGADPGSVLARVDQLVASMRIPRSASLVLATLQRADDGWDLAYSRAGHLPPLVARGSGVERLDGAGGPLIGFGDGDRSTARHRLAPGDLLVLYTDGLIERRDRSLRDGLEALVGTTAAIGPQDAAGAGEQLLSRLADSPEDDVAVVVLRVPDPDSPLDRSGSPRRRRWSLPSEAGSIRRARQAVARTCAAWEIEGAPSAELVVSELVANAVMHGWGHVVLRLFDTGDGLRIEVEDSNPAPPVTTDGHPGRVGGYGMRIVERLGDWGWRPSGTGKLVWARVRPAPISRSLAPDGPTAG